VLLQGLTGRIVFDCEDNLSSSGPAKVDNERKSGVGFVVANAKRQSGRPQAVAIGRGMASRHRSDTSEGESPKAKEATARKARLKLALRENLKRRKGQTRPRLDGDAAKQSQE